MITMSMRPNYYCDKCKHWLGESERDAKNHAKCYRCDVPLECKYMKHTCYDIWCDEWRDLFSNISEAITLGITNQEVWDKWTSHCNCD